MNENNKNKIGCELNENEFNEMKSKLNCCQIKIDELIDSPRCDQIICDIFTNNQFAKKIKQYILHQKQNQTDYLADSDCESEYNNVNTCGML